MNREHSRRSLAQLTDEELVHEASKYLSSVITGEAERRGKPDLVDACRFARSRRIEEVSERVREAYRAVEAEAADLVVRFV